MGQQDRAERERFENEVRRIVEAGSAAGVTLRLLGSLAFQFHCPEFGFLQEKMGRAYTDIDFAGYGREAKNVRALMAGLGYAEDKEVWVVSEGGRAIFNHPALKLHVDVFYEKLDFSHVIPWAGRLETDSPTIPLAETAAGEDADRADQREGRDRHDHAPARAPAGETDRETINMNACRQAVLGGMGAVAHGDDEPEQGAPAGRRLPPTDRQQKNDVAIQIDGAMAHIEASPKSMAWRMRARVGDRVKWYKDVDEVM